MTNIDETDITYGIGIREAYRGHDRIYGGGSPERGWVWELSQWEPVVETDEETIRRQIPLVASPSVFQQIEEAEENAVLILRILEPDPGRDCPINHALLALKTWGT